jgi:hypothetical protein
MSVQTTNALSTIVLSTSLESAAVAWAAHAISSPIGAVGGAIFGAVRSLSRYPLALIGEKLLNSTHPQAAQAAKVLAAALVILGSYAAAWGVLVAAGMAITFQHVVQLTVVSIFTSIGIDILLRCFGLNTAPARH